MSEIEQKNNFWESTENDIVFPYSLFLDNDFD